MLSRVGKLSHSVFWCVLWILIGILLTLLYTQGSNSHGQACLARYPLTSQDLDCMEYSQSYKHIHALQSDLDTATAQYIKEGKATRVSIWVRDLKTKQWAAINENDLFDPASLSKLPIAIAYYKVAEVEPSILFKKLQYKQASQFDDSVQDFVPASTLVVGTEYTVNELIEDMLVNSDNNAAGVLETYLDPGILTNTLIDLGIAVPQETSVHDFVAPKTYANIFRILYNASYLNRTDSQTVLNLLNKEAYRGISVPLPKGIIVAHKFGEREFVYSDGSIAKRQLHDCGNVYKTSDPYTICIMTEGTDFKDLEAIIHDLSILTYNQL